MPLLANINVGSAPNDGTGNSIRDSFIIVNENFQFVESFFPNTSVISLTANITSTGNSAFNNLTITGTTTSAGNISANYLFGNGSQLTSVAATTSGTATFVTGNAQANITSVGTLTSLNLTGDLTGSNVSAGIIGNTGSVLVGTLTTATQPNITLVGNLTNITVAGGNITVIGSNRYLVGSRLTIGTVVAIQRNGGTDWNSNLTAVAIDFGANNSQLRGIAANANVAVTWTNLDFGLRYDLYIKNRSGSTIFATLPNDNNNKASNVIPITTGITALFVVQTFDSNSANVVTTITNT
jgi:hypothetical protein